MRELVITLIISLFAWIATVTACSLLCSVYAMYINNRSFMIKCKSNMVKLGCETDLVWVAWYVW